MIRGASLLLIERIEAHMRRTKMSPSRFGRESLGDPNFVTSLRDGRMPRGATIRRVTAYIEGGAKPQRRRR